MKKINFILLQESMKIMGLPNWLHWTAWFVKTFTFLFLTIVLIVLLITISWYPGTTFSVFTLANPSVIFLFLLLFGCATITYSFAISVFFSRGNFCYIVVDIVLLFMFFCSQYCSASSRGVVVFIIYPLHFYAKQV